MFMRRTIVSLPGVPSASRRTRNISHQMRDIGAALFEFLLLSYSVSWQQELQGGMARIRSRTNKSRDHRVRQHRHRSDDQDHADVGVLEMGAMVGIDPEQRRPEARRAAGRGDDRMRASTGWTTLPVWPEIGIVFDATSAAAHKKQQRSCAGGGQDHDRPHAGGDRPLCHSGGQWRRASGCAQRQHGDLRRPGDHPDRGGGQPGRPRCIMPRSSRRSPPNRPAPAPAPISTSSPKPPRAASRRSAARTRARRSSSSIRPSRR